MKMKTIKERISLSYEQVTITSFLGQLNVYNLLYTIRHTLQPLHTQIIRQWPWAFGGKKEILAYKNIKQLLDLTVGGLKWMLTLEPLLVLVNAQMSSIDIPRNHLSCLVSM